MVVDKRGRYYAPMMLVVLYTMMLSHVVAIALKRHQTAESEAIRVAMSLEKMRWQSPIRGTIEEIRHLGIIDEVCFISPYDDLFVEISEKYGTDWRLMSAIAYCESRFTPYAESQVGALGMMQIMPRTATSYSVSIEKLSDPKINIDVANQHYRYIERLLNIPSDTLARDRAALILAGYNGGIGRVFDAMRLARAEGHDPHKWSVIRRYLALLRLPYYYERDDVYCGQFSTPYTTIRYAEDVIAQYDIYCEKTDNCTSHLLPIGNGIHRH